MPDQTLFVTVIMPVRNEADFIARSLGAVLAQDYPPDRMEVFIADGMSDDDTRAIIAQTAAQQPHIPVTLLDNPGRIAATGLNIATQKARGDIIVRVDGHCEIAPDYVTQCVRLLQSGEYGGVGGAIETIGLNPVSQVIALAMSSGFGVGGSAFRTVKDKTLLVDTIAFPAYTRAAVEMAGAYDEALVRNQDDEYNYRLRALGCRLLLSADVHVRYYSRGTLRSLWRQYFGYGFWKVRVMQKHPRQMSLRQFIPPLFVAALIGSGGLALFSDWGRRLLALIAGSYALANLAASLWTLRRRSGGEKFWLLPVVFAVLHLSYGTGFLVGLVKFGRR